LNFLAFTKLFFTFFAVLFSFRKKGQLNSTGLYYCVSVWTPEMAPVVQKLDSAIQRISHPVIQIPVGKNLQMKSRLILL